MQKTWVWSLGWKDPLEKGKSTHSSILAWRIPWTLSDIGSQSQTQLSDLHFTSLHTPSGESNDQPKQHIKKQKHYFADKSPSSQSYGFSSSHVWMWELDYKAEHWRIDAFEPRCWRRLSRVSWTAGRSHQSILKEISPEYSLGGLMLRLKLQ